MHECVDNGDVSTPRVVQATDRRLGSGAIARDAFFDRFSTNMRAALANADYVASPSSPALFALVRESGGGGGGRGVHSHPPQITHLNSSVFYRPQPMKSTYFPSVKPQVERKRVVC